MNQYKIHLWLIINLALAAGLYYQVALVKYLFMPLFLVNMLLLKSKKEIKEEYTSNVGWPGILVAVVFVSALVIAAFSGLTKRLNETDIFSTNIAVSVFLLVIAIMYLVEIKSILNEKT